jgi:hypothetical protein
MNSLFKEQPGSPRLRAMALSLCVSTAALASVGALVAQAQEGDPTDTAATDTPTDTSATDTPPPAPSGPEDVVAPPPPWAGTTDVEPPDFLDTTDRRIVDDRPPPTPDQIRALLEMEAEADRFTRSGTGYRNAIVSILRRDYMRQRRERETGYARQITEEERLTREAMEDAIVHLERFIRRYPSDPKLHARRDVPPRRALLRAGGAGVRGRGHRQRSPPTSCRSSTSTAISWRGSPSTGTSTGSTTSSATA